MSEKTFTLDINGYEYELDYWTFPWIAQAVADLKESSVSLNLRASGGIDLWIKPGYQVSFVFADPHDPEIPERLTQYQLMSIFDGDRLYGYRVLDLHGDDREPCFSEWDNPNF
ncbi:hypothetical protein [Corynebacterium ulcerans]|uniref:hypothetical protein n=1 Tax=Corynebacterium ulcerans TaxID=65058 RepID=UPI0034A2673E